MTLPWREAWRCACLAFLLVLGSMLGPSLARAQSPTPCDLYGPAPEFPHIPLCAFPGAYQDSTLLFPRKCLGSFTGPQPDSVVARARTITVRFRRDRRAENRRDFGGYRIYRVFNAPDTTKMVLIRRYTRQSGDQRPGTNPGDAGAFYNWNFSTVTPDTTFRYVINGTDTTKVVQSITLPLLCKGQVANDSVVTFVDPDSSGNWIKLCRLRNPQEGTDGLCASFGDSVFVLKSPPGPHDGFRIWYAITYEGKNASLDGNYADLFVPDTLHCANPADHSTCPNLNHKLLNLAGPVEATGGPTPNLERVVVVPNPFRAREAWDTVGGHELHFINLPRDSRIRIYTVAGDLVAELQHHDPIRDFETWNLRNDRGQDVASGIYMFRVESGTFTFQDRFIVIR